MRPFKGWTPENIETYARYLAENYYVDEDGNTEPRRSEAAAYEEWKPVAAQLGMPRTGRIEFPGEVLTRAEAIRYEMAQAEVVRAAAPELLSVVLRWKADLERVNPDFNDPEANALLLRLGVADEKRTPTEPSPTP